MEGGAVMGRRARGGRAGEEPAGEEATGATRRRQEAGGGGRPLRFEPAPGWIAREVEEELPGLGLTVVDVEVARRGSLTGTSPPDVLERLRALSSRFRGARAVSMRREHVPGAYRVFYRQVGLDPDAQRTPIEAAVLERMLRGGFLSGGLIEDVLTIALLDTSVPVWALDADSLDGPLGIRSSREGEPLGSSRDALALPAGQLVVADASSAVAVLFGDLGAGHAVSARTRRVALFAVRVAGVPELYAEEALWSCATSLAQP
jgi:DNA/RNA-binding domain of Phe-tRNA-synthetase-like protein